MNLSRNDMTLAECGHCRREGPDLIVRANCPDHDLEGTAGTQSPVSGGNPRPLPDSPTEAR